MDSNESSEDKIVEEANKMEVSDSSAQDNSSEKTLDKLSTKKMVTEEHNECEDSITYAETNHNKSKAVDFQITESVKINTLQNDEEVKKNKEMIDDGKSDSDSNSVRDMERLEIDSSESETQEPPMDAEEIANTYDTKDSKGIECTKDITDIGDTKDAHVTKDTENAKNVMSTENEIDGKNITDIIDKKNKENKNNIKNNTDLMNIKDTKDIHDTKNSKDIKKCKKTEEIKEVESTEKEATKEIKETKESKESEEIKETRKTKEIKETKNTKDTKDTKDTKEIKDTKDTKEIKDIKDTKNVKDDVDVKITKDVVEIRNINTREGKRKRRSTLSLLMSSSPPREEQSQALQQNGSGTKRKRGAAAGAVAAAAAAESEASGSDRFCWRCHKESVEMRCSTCPRSSHRRCMGGAPPLNVTNWLCGECTGILQAENVETRSPAMALITIDQLCMMLKHVVERMRDQTGSEPFLKPVDLEEVPTYLDYIVKPMDLSLLEANVRAKMYGSTDAFMADAKWIQHNCIVYNTYTSKLTNTAKQMLKVARQEVSEIEACPDCFAHGRNLPRPLASWFVEPCRRPHPIVWAKLKGFPFWPAKAMPRLNASGLVDVRFFGEHDRAWVSPKDIYLYSQEPPAPLPRKKKPEMDQCVKEVQEHAKKLEQVFGQFRFAPAKVQYDPQDVMQIKILLPYYDPIQNKVVRAESTRSRSQTPSAFKKITPTRPERKSISARNTVMMNANGARPDTPRPPMPEKRKIGRRKRTASPALMQPPPIPAKLKKLSPEIEEVVILAPAKKGKSKSPPVVVAPTVNDNSEKKNNITKTNSNDLNKNNSAPEVDPKPGINNGNKGLKPTLMPVRKVKRDLIRRIKLTRVEKPEEPIKKSNALAKAPNATKLNAMKPNAMKPNAMKPNAMKPPATVVHAMPPLNSLSNSIEPVKIPSPIKPTTTTATMATPTMTTTSTLKMKSILKPIAIAPKKPNLIPISVKAVNAKLIINPESGRPLNKAPLNASKEPMKMPVIVGTTSLKGKEDLLPSGNGKPMTVIPVCPKMDQKSMFNAMNSSTSESAKHFNNHKEIKLNSAVTIIKQEPKDDIPQPKLVITRKSGKARKSFPNKTPQFPQQTTSPLSKSTPSDAMVYIPGQPSSETRTSTSTATAPTTAVVSSSSTSPAYELPPPEAGPATAQIHQNSRELANKIAQLIADTIKDASESNGVGTGSLINHHEATIHYLKLKMERMKWEHEQEIAELKHNNELLLRETKAGMDVERYRALQDARREAEIDKLRCIEETKRKQWCVVCGREAMFFCCWNTAYCDYPCQQKHWTSHVATCAQKTSLSGQSLASTSPQKPGNAGSAAAKQQVMPKLVINRPQQTPVTRRA